MFEFLIQLFNEATIEQQIFTLMVGIQAFILLSLGIWFVISRLVISKFGIFLIRKRVIQNPKHMIFILRRYARYQNLPNSPFYPLWIRVAGKDGSETFEKVSTNGIHWLGNPPWAKAKEVEESELFGFSQSNFDLTRFNTNTNGNVIKVDFKKKRKVS